MATKDNYRKTLRDRLSKFKEKNADEIRKAKEILDLKRELKLTSLINKAEKKQIELDYTIKQYHLSIENQFIKNNNLVKEVVTNCVKMVDNAFNEMNKEMTAFENYLGSEKKELATFIEKARNSLIKEGQAIIDKSRMYADQSKSYSEQSRLFSLESKRFAEQALHSVHEAGKIISNGIESFNSHRKMHDQKLKHAWELWGQEQDARETKFQNFMSQFYEKMKHERQEHRASVDNQLSQDERNRVASEWRQKYVMSETLRNERDNYEAGQELLRAYEKRLADYEREDELQMQRDWEKFQDPNTGLLTRQMYSNKYGW